MKKILCIILALVLAVAFVACSKAGKESESELWTSAVYSADTELGSGEKTVTVDVVAAEKTVTFTVKTDADTLGTALADAGLIEGEKGEFGLYITAVNGIAAIWETDGAYWALSKNGEYLMTGVDTTPIADGEHYELTYTKG